MPFRAGVAARQYWLLILLLVAGVCLPARAQDRPDVTFKVFQFPADMIPRIDGNPDDWAVVPAEYVIGTDELVDGDLSGGPLIDRMHPNKRLDQWDAYFSFHGVHAQNYHIFTPAVGKDWALA